MIVFCRRLAENETFQSFILVLILLSAFGMGLETVPQLIDEYGVVFDLLYYTTQAVFAFEILVRLLAFWPRLRKFFDEFWNTFDFTIVVLSFVPGIGSFALVARLFRVLRVLRVFSVSDRLRGFIDRLKDSFDEAIYAALLLFVLGYVFTIAGFYLFSPVDPAHWGSFGRATLSVFYLFLLQNVAGYVDPVIAAGRLHMFYFLLFYFAEFGLLLSTLCAALRESCSKQ